MNGDLDILTLISMFLTHGSTDVGRTKRLHVPIFFVNHNKASYAWKCNRFFLMYSGNITCIQGPEHIAVTVHMNQVFFVVDWYPE